VARTEHLWTTEQLWTGGNKSGQHTKPRWAALCLWRHTSNNNDRHAGKRQPAGPEQRKNDQTAIDVRESWNAIYDFFFFVSVG
jgi:hypothetical protein